MIGSDLMFLCIRITFGSRPLCEIANLVRPFFFRTDALLHQRLNSIAENSAAILIRRAFHHALVVVNEEPAKIDKLHAVSDLKEFESADERVRGATAKFPLIVTRQTFI